MMLEVNHLSFSYGHHAVLHDCSFGANAGELIAVQGPNGVGKSTLFRCILGLLSDYSGKISCAGTDIRSLSRRELAQRIAYIPQSTSPVFHYTVEETVLMGSASRLGVFSQPNAVQRAAVWKVLEDLGIPQLAGRGFAQLSGGEQQLVLIARALVQQARILIMDEPTANLDFGNQHRVMRRIQALAREGYTILFSTHNPEQAFLYAEKALVLQDGSVRAFGLPQQELTGQLLSDLYGIPVTLKTVSGRYGPISICLPD